MTFTNVMCFVSSIAAEPISGLVHALLSLIAFANYLIKIDSILIKEINLSQS